MKISVVGTSDQHTKVILVWFSSGGHFTTCSQHAYNNKFLFHDFMTERHIGHVLFYINVVNIKQFIIPTISHMFPFIHQAIILSFQQHVQVTCFLLSMFSVLTSSNLPLQQQVTWLVMDCVTLMTFFCYCFQVHKLSFSGHQLSNG